MLIAVAMFAVVGGALAVKAARFGHTIYLASSTTGPITATVVGTITAANFPGALTTYATTTTTGTPVLTYTIFSAQ